MNLEREPLRAWLREAMLQNGDSPTALARRAGLAQSTITRFLTNDDAPLLGLRSITKIAQAARIAPPGFYVRNGSSGHGKGVKAPEASLFDFGDVGDRQKAVIASVLGDRKSTDPWVLNSEALKFRGYVPGDILIVDFSVLPHSGQIACAQVYTWSDATAETVFRIYEPPYLVAASDDPSLWRPHLVDNNRVIIKGMVTESIRFLR